MKNPFRKQKIVIAFAVLSTLLAVTFITWSYVVGNVERLSEAKFDQQIDTYTHEVQNLLGFYKSQLEQVKNLYETNPPPDNIEFQQYFHLLPSSGQYAGIQALAFIERVSDKNLAAFTAEMRKEYGNFSVSPPGERPEYYVVKYNVPYAGNEAAIGKDILTLLDRKTTAMKARDSGGITITPKVTLLTGSPENRTGVVLFSPVHRKGASLGTVVERRSALIGMINMVLSTNKLFRGALVPTSDIDLEVFDGTTTAQGALLFDYDNTYTSGTGSARNILGGATYEPRFDKVRQIQVADRVWTLHFVALPNFDATVLSPYARIAPNLVIVIGITLSFLISFLLYTVAGARERAVALASEMTLRYRRSNEELEKKAEELSDKTRQISEQNKNLLQIRTAILNVLDDLSAEKTRTDEERAKDEAILAGIGEGLFAVDTRGSLILINDVFAKMIDLKKDEALGKSFLKLFNLVDEHGVPLPDDKRPMSIVLANRSTMVTASLQLMRKNGSMVPVRMTVTPILVGDKILGGVNIVHDVTREKEIEKLRTDFLTLASHQLRTPLSGTKWLIETMQKGIVGSFTKKQKEYLENIHGTNEKMIKLVYDMLSVLRLESGDDVIAKEKVSARALFDDVLLTTQAAAKSKKISLRNMFVDNRTVDIMTDPVILRSVIENFVSNAINYSLSGAVSYLTLTIARRRSCSVSPTPV